VKLKLFIIAGLFLAAVGVGGAFGGTGEKVAELITQLGAKEWKTREEAQDKIFLLFARDAEPAADAVARGFLAENDPEIKLRLEKILNRMAPEHVRRGERGFLGVSLGKLKGPVKVGDEIYHPIDIVAVLAGTSAQAAGIINGERILRIDDFKCEEATTVEDVVKYISSKGPGAKLRFVNLTPDKKVKARTIVLGERPSRPEDPADETVREYMMSEWLTAVLRKAEKTLAAEKPTEKPQP